MVVVRGRRLRSAGARHQGYDRGVRPRRSDFTTRLQKGGALLPDMRVLVSIWSEQLGETDPVPELVRSLPKATPARVRDTYTRAFLPRLVNGSPPGAWRLARVLEDREADMQIVRPFYYWITARSERPLYGFVMDVVYPRARTADREVRIEEAVSWLSQQGKTAGKAAWTPVVTQKVARGILAALRDFGVLEGRLHKRILATSLSPEACSLIAFCLNGMGATGQGLVQHRDWRLFLLGQSEVETLLLECHKHGWLRFECAGSLCRTEFPGVSFEEYSRDVLD